MTSRLARTPAENIIRRIRVYGYTRLSSDPQGQRKEHLTQITAINQIVARYGLPPIAPEDWFNDTDKSSKAGVYRRDWQAMLESIRNDDRKTVQPVVLCWEQLRLSREDDGTEVIADLLENKRGRLISSFAGEIPIKKGARDQLYFTATSGKLEQQRIQARGGGGVDTAAQAGRAHGPVAYGWSRIYPQVDAGRPKGVEVLNEAEAAIVCELATRVLAGESLKSIARDMNERGVPAPGAGKVRKREEGTRDAVAWASVKWVPNKVRQVLLRKANIGIREHHHQDLEPGDPVPEYDADWPRILEDDVYVQVRALLTAPDRDRRKIITNVARHLLSNIATCGICRQTLTTQPVRRSDGTIKFVYRCRASHVSKAEHRVDEHVSQAAIEWISRKSVQKGLARDAGGAASRIQQANESKVALVSKMKRLVKDLRDDVYTPEQAREINLGYRADLRALDEELERPHETDLLGDFAREPDKATAWKAYPLERRRAIVAAAFKVTAYPSPRQGKSAWDKSLVIIVPRLPY